MENKSERVNSSETETESRLETFFRLKEEFNLMLIDRNARNGIIIIMSFIKISCLIAQAQCLTNWGDCERPKLMSQD